MLLNSHSFAGLPSPQQSTNLPGLFCARNWTFSLDKERKRGKKIRERAKIPMKMWHFHLQSPSVKKKKKISFYVISLH